MSTRAELVRIFEDTYTLSHTKYRYTDKTINLSPKMKITLSPIDTTIPKPSVHITHGDCYADAISLTGRTGVVNSASMLNRGGGVEHGARAQEESMCCRSNLYAALEQFEYPLFNKTRGIYIPNVSIFKSPKYTLYSAPHSVDVISVFSRPIDKIKSDDELNALYDTIFQSIWHICNEYKLDNLVLVPIGCGVFGHDPYYVAESLKLYLDTYKLSTVKNIIVSCYTNDDNYKAFTHYFPMK